MKHVVGLLVASVALRGDPVLVGLSQTGSEVRFAIKAGEHGAAGWLRLGDEVAGCTLVAYEPADETLVTRSAAGFARLRLNTAKAAMAEAGPAELSALARQEVLDREGWASSVRCGEPRLHGEEVWIVVTRGEPGGKNEARLIVIAKGGKIKDYLRV